MKKVAALIAGILAFATTASAQIGVFNFDFIAPSVPTLADAPNQVGLIVYDSGSNQFFGRTGQASPNDWIQFGGGGGGGSYANQDLSNLISTAVNADILPAGASVQKLGGPGKEWYSSHINFGYIASYSSPGREYGILQAGETPTMAEGGAFIAMLLGYTNVGMPNSGPVAVATANGNGGASGNMYLETGNAAGSGDSGSINMTTGTAPGTRGHIKMDALYLQLPVGTADPTAPAGSVYYNSSANKLRLYDGSAWVDLN